MSRGVGTLLLASACRSSPQGPVTGSAEPAGPFAVDLQLDLGAPGLVRCEDGDGDDHAIAVPDARPVRAHGLLAGTTYVCSSVGLRGAGPVWSAEVSTPEAAGLPELAVSVDADGAVAHDGYVVFTHWARGTAGWAHRVIVVDAEGRPRWSRSFPQARSGGIAADWTGDRFVIGGGGIPPSLWTLDGDQEERVAPPAFPDPEDDVYNHEARWTPDGLLSLQTVPDSDGVHTWRGFRVEVTDPTTDEVTWRFDSREAVEVGVLPPGDGLDDDPYHANAVSWRDDDPWGPSMWVSLRGKRMLLRVDRESGAMTQLGQGGDYALVDASGQALPDEQWFQGQHAPHPVGDRFLVYDNGTFRSAPRTTRVAAYEQRDDEVVFLWDWSEPGWFEPNYGSVQWLPRGRVLVGSGHCASCASAQAADRSWIAELDPARGEVLWRASFARAEDTVYRATWVDGCTLFRNQRYCHP